MMNCAQMSKEQLLDYIDMVSFSAHEALLFLDTHPADKEARRFYNEYMKQRNYAMKEYARRYSPLTAVSCFCLIRLKNCFALADYMNTTDCPSFFVI